MNNNGSNNYNLNTDESKTTAIINSIINDLITEYPNFRLNAPRLCSQNRGNGCVSILSKH